MEDEAARAEDEGGSGCVGVATGAQSASGEVKIAASREEGVALFGEEETEAREVDLLLVDLHLREIGVDGDIGRQVRCDRIPGVPADLAAEIVGNGRCQKAIGC